jgi:nucleoside-diphosphate-sugar epimerase
VIYSVAKIAAKNALKMKAMEIGMDFIHVLHSHVMGPGDDKDSFLQVTLSKLVNREELVFSSGEQLFDVVSLYDCCNGYFLICSKGIGGCQYWVGSGEPRKLRDYVEKMYVMYPSPVKLEFGKLSYNDIKLQPSDFSIDLLTLHTGYAPRDSYEDAVRDLHNSLYNSSFLQ